MCFFRLPRGTFRNPRKGARSTIDGDNRDGATIRSDSEVAHEKTWLQALRNRREQEPLRVPVKIDAEAALHWGCAPCASEAKRVAGAMKRYCSENCACGTCFLDDDGDEVFTEECPVHWTVYPYGWHPNVPYGRKAYWPQPEWLEEVGGGLEENVPSQA